MTSVRYLKLAVMAVAALSVSACLSLLPETEPSAVYRLSAPAPHDWTGEDWILVRIDRPLAPRGLAGDEVALLMGDRHLAYMAGARWITTAPRIVQNLVIDTFNATDDRIAPARPDDGVQSDYELKLDLREFEAAYDRGPDSAPVVRVRLAARLIAEEGRRFVGARVFTAEIRATTNQRRAIIDAFDAAANQATRELASWTANLAAD
jgi:cholesterol transport system auxiliary component